MTLVSQNDTCATKWHWGHKMTLVSQNDTCVTKWHLCHKMTLVSQNDSCVTKWLLCHKMTLVSQNDTCVTKWHLCQPENSYFTLFFSPITSAEDWIQCRISFWTKLDSRVTLLSQRSPDIWLYGSISICQCKCLLTHTAKVLIDPYSLATEVKQM